MSDLQHLPDLPNVGYSSPRAKLLSDQIMTTMRQVERNRLQLVTIVLGGLEKWRKSGKDAFGSWMPTEMLDQMYEYFRLQAADGTPFQAELLGALQNDVKTREIVRRFWPYLEQQYETLKIMEKWSPVQRAGWHG